MAVLGTVVRSFLFLSCLAFTVVITDELLFLPRPLPHECTPELPEFFCADPEKFAWCEDSSYIETCPAGLVCDMNLPFLCAQPLDPNLTTLAPEEETSEELEENVPWNMEASPPPECVKPGRFPDISDCATFHVCVPDDNENLTHFAVNCPSGSHYSSSSSKCAIPERAKCDNEFKDYICPNSGHIPDPRDCSQFILCYPEGIWRRYSCPTQSYFDSETLKCSASQNVCLKSKENKFICKRRGLYSHESHCRKFYYCIPLGNKFIQGSAICPKGSLFNPETSRCTLKNVCNAVSKLCKGRRFARYPDLEDCSKFYVCAGNGSALYSCPYGSQFSPQLRRCVQDNKSPCGRTLLNCREQGIFPDYSSKCKGFYTCLQRPGGLTGQRYKCPGSSVFDPFFMKCTTSMSPQECLSLL